ncbi:MAG: hypothetical protein HRT87_01575 [Legionellales bacterium]|nr:hypothetical protein [Legionellales bacterium]
MNSSKDISEMIKNEKISNDNLREWFEEHRIIPEKIELYESLTSSQKKTFWLITQYNQKEDSSYRIAYNSEKNSFGLEVTTSSDESKYMGDYGNLDNALESM